MTRARLRAGRRARYFPTAAEATSFGVGPYGASITKINADGSADLAVDVPSAVAADITEAGAADATYGATPEAALINQNRILTDELRARELLRFKASIARGGQAGQYDLNAGPSAV